MSHFTIGGFRKQHLRILRAVALFFLLYTCADIALPQYFCAGEVASLPNVTATSMAVVDVVHATAGNAVVSDTKNSRPARPEQEAPHDEDCFCCCVHVLPALPVTRVGGSEIKSPPAPRELKSFPAPPLGGTFRPPRSA